jgi:hypothetical protein
VKRTGVFFLIICIGIIFGCFFGWGVDFLPSTGVFTSWELLDSPVKFTKIVHINSDGIWAETEVRKLYFWGFFDYCFLNPQEICNQWVETTEIPDDAYRNDYSRMSKDKNCPESSINPKKYPGEITECALVFLRRGSGFSSTYFALVKDGTLWEWAPPSGTDFPIMTTFIGPSIGALFGIIVGIGYLIFQRCKVLLPSRQANKACTRRVGVCAFYKHLSGFGFFLHLKPFPSPPTRG